MIAQKLRTTTPLAAPTHEIDSSEDEKDIEEEEEAHINGQDQNTPGIETTDRAATIHVPGTCLKISLILMIKN